MPYTPFIYFLMEHHQRPSFPTLFPPDYCPMPQSFVDGVVKCCTNRRCPLYQLQLHASHVPGESPLQTEEVPKSNRQTSKAIVGLHAMVSTNDNSSSPDKSQTPTQTQPEEEEEDTHSVTQQDNNSPHHRNEDEASSSVPDDTSDVLAKGASSIIGSVMKDFDFKADNAVKSQDQLSSAIDRLTGELDQLLEDAPVPFIMQQAAKISGVRKRVSSLNSLLKSIQRRIDNIDRMLSTGSAHEWLNPTSKD